LFIASFRRLNSLLLVGNILQKIIGVTFLYPGNGFGVGSKESVIVSPIVTS